jgi:flagellin-like protein
MPRKGISALISTVLIMAVTVSLAGLFSSWAPGLINDVTDDVNNQTGERLACNEGSVDIVSAKYYSGDNTTAVVRNTGSIELEELRISAWDSDIPMNSTIVSVKPGNFTSENISTTSKPTSVRAFSRRCGDITAVFEDIQ